MPNVLSVLPRWAQPRLLGFVSQGTNPIDQGRKVAIASSAGKSYLATIEEVALSLRDECQRLDGTPADLDKAPGFVKLASGYRAAYETTRQGLSLVVSPQGEASDSVVYYRLSEQETRQATLHRKGVDETVVELFKPDVKGWLIQSQDSAVRVSSLPASPWKVPTSGSSRILGRQVIELLALENARSPETDTGATLHCDMHKAVLVHQFALENFGSIAFHGFLSTAETYSDKFLGHKERLLNPQERLNIELDLSSESHRKLLPKYAFCVIPERPAELGYPQSTDYPLTYGAAEAVLRKEVQQRSSWSYGDSLSLHASSGPRSRAHTFEESALRRDLAQSSQFLEAQVWGELTLADVDHFVLPAWLPGDVEKRRQSMATDQTEDSFRANQLEVESFDRFLDTCRLLKIPVHVGEIRGLLTRTHDETGAEVSPAFTTDRVLVRGLPADQRPQIERTLLESVLGRAQDQSGSRMLLPKGFFQPGTAPEQQAKAFEDLQQAYLDETIKSSN